MSTPASVAASAWWGAKAAYATAVALLVLAGAIVWVDSQREQPWNPLGDYPTQVVLTPEVPLGELVVVTGVKCSTENVTVRGVLSWQAIDPPGAVIDVGQGADEREVGCTRRRFRNDIPEAVAEVIRQQHDAGITRPVWRLTGTETPFDDTREGVPRTFVTENFVVVP